MSYAVIRPSYYQMWVPGTPWESGAPGWSEAPVPGWGENPNLVGPSYLATEGLGAYYANHQTEPINGLGCGCETATNGLGEVSPALGKALIGVILLGVGWVIYDSNRKVMRERKELAEWQRRPKRSLL